MNSNTGREKSQGSEKDDYLRAPSLNIFGLRKEITSKRCTDLHSSQREHIVQFIHPRLHWCCIQQGIIKLKVEIFHRMK